jgi:tetratricopeptide (TPR) repeat protein
MTDVWEPGRYRRSPGTPGPDDPHAVEDLIDPDDPYGTDRTGVADGGRGGGPSGSGGSSETEESPTARDRELAWELLDAQPDNPRIAELAHRVLSEEPWRTGIMLLLGNHYDACGRTAEARRIYQDACGRGDKYFPMAIAELRDLEFSERNYAEGLRHARTAVEADPESWHNHMQVGYGLATVGEFDEGWDMIARSVQMCAQTDPDQYADALAAQTILLADTYAPPWRQIPSADAAMRANPANSWAIEMLGWALILEYRFAEAEDVALRTLREDPTNDFAATIAGLAKQLRSIIDDSEFGLDDIRRAGTIEMAWKGLRDQHLGIDLASALAALEEVMPPEVRATFRPPLTPEQAEERPGSDDTVTTWHDGQLPGTGAVWGLGASFRFMSSEEIEAMDEQIEAKQQDWPRWPQNERWDQYLTDDAGGYVIAVEFDRFVLRMPGVDEDIPIADSPADWVWDRVVAFGGHDPRPARRPLESFVPVEPRLGARQEDA